MDLSTQSLANIDYMLDTIKRKLKMASAAALKAEHFDLDLYEDIFDIYDVVSNKEQFSIREIESLVAELGKLRKPVQ